MDAERVRSDAGLVHLGFASAAGQGLLFRELATLGGGNEIVAAFMLASWLLLSAAGSLAGTGLRRSFGSSWALAGPLLLAPAVVLSLLGARVSRPFLVDVPGTAPPLLTLLACTIVLLAPFCLVAGALFPSLACGARTAAQGARAYALESVGFLAGGAAVSFLLVPLLSDLQAVALVAAAGGLTVLAAGAGLAPRAAGALLAAACLLLALPVVGGGLDLSTRAAAFAGETLVAFRDTPRGTAAVTERDGLLTLRGGTGRCGDTGPTVRCEEFVHLPLLHHPRPESVVLLGGGFAGELARVLEHAASVVLVLPGPQDLDLFRPHLRAEDARALADPRVRILFEDGRVFLRREAGTGRRFDAILLPLGDPLTGARNRFYTAECYAQAARVLAPGGLLATSLSAAPGYRGPARTRLAGSVRAALAEGFPFVREFPTDFAGRLFLAARAAPDGGAPVLAGRAVERGLPRDWTDAARMAQRLAPETLPRPLEGDVPANRDLKPVSYLLAFSLEASRFGPRDPLPLSALVVLPLALTAVFIPFARRWAGGRGWPMPSLAAALAGLSGMAFEVGFLLAFQAAAGTVFAHLGALVAATMAGAAAGAWTAGKVAGSRAAVLAAGTALAALGVASVFALGPAVSLLAPGTALALFAGLHGGAGFLAASFFPFALARLPVEGAAGVLYAADLAGAALAALLAGALVVPLAGIPALLLGAALAAALAAAVLASAGRAAR